MSELKPCPFCGGEAVVVLCPTIGLEKYIEPVVMCEKCWAKTDYYETDDEAIEAWNTRHERTCRIEGTYSDEFAIYDHLTCGHVNLRHWHEPTSYCSTCGAKVVE